MTNNGRIDCLDCSFDELLHYIEQKLRNGDSKEANIAISIYTARINQKDQSERKLLKERLETLLSKVTMTKTGGDKQKIDFSKSKGKRA